MRKISLVVFIILGGLCVYFLMSNLVLKQALSQIKETRDSEMKQVLLEERKAILRDVEEKHKADMVSFEAMAKRMEIERQRNRQLEEKLGK